MERRPFKAKAHATSYRNTISSKQLGTNAITTCWRESSIQNQQRTET
jgi:hypothetical protein